MHLRQQKRNQAASWRREWSLREDCSAAQWACSSSSTCVAVSDAQGANRAEAEQLVKEADVAIVVIGTSSGEDTIEKT